MCIVYVLSYVFLTLLANANGFKILLMLQNRKNDEVSYEKMLKLKKDLNKAL